MTPCSTKGCPHSATHVPVLYIPAVGHPAEESRAVQLGLGVELCRRCCEAMKPSDILDVPNDKGATLRSVLPHLIRAARGPLAPLPDADRAWISPTRIGSKTQLSLARALRDGGAP